MKSNIQETPFNYSLLDLITLHQLRIFELAASKGNFTHAARDLNLTQPTVSAQIKQLEEAIGLPLFERFGKRLYLTDAGRELQRTCHEIFAQMAQSELHLLEFQATTQGALHLGVTTTAKYFLPQGIQQFQQRYPGIYISVEVNSHAMILDRLNDNTDDLYIFSRLPDRNDLVIQPFLANPLVVVAPCDHWLTQIPDPIPLSTIAAELMIMRERGSATREASERCFAQQGIQIRPKFELGSNEAIKVMVSQGLGLTILSQHSLWHSTNTAQLKVLNVEYFPIQQQWYLVYPHGKYVSRIMKIFTDFCINHYDVLSICEIS